MEARLQSNPVLLGDQFSIADAAVIPFVRQFAAVDPAWFDQAYPKLRNWNTEFIHSNLFTAVMQKNAVWQSGQPPVVIQGETSDKYLSQQRLRSDFDNS